VHRAQRRLTDRRRGAPPQARGPGSHARRGHGRGHVGRATDRRVPVAPRKVRAQVPQRVLEPRERRHFFPTGIHERPQKRRLCNVLRALNAQAPHREMGGDALQQQLDAACERNERLQLENLRFRSNGPKLHKLVVRFSSSVHSLRGGVKTHLKQLGAAFACDCAAIGQAVSAVDAATRERESASAAERGRLARRGGELEAALQERQAAAQVLEGRLQALTADLERKADAHRELKETFDEERARADELQQEADSWKRNCAVKDERIACLEQAQGALAAQVQPAGACVRVRVLQRRERAPKLSSRHDACRVPSSELRGARRR